MYVYSFWIYFQRDATLHSLFISGKLLYMFQVVSSPIIRSTYNCIYSIWYFLNITVICLYCGRVGAGLSVVWELYRSVQFPHHTQTSFTLQYSSLNIVRDEPSQTDKMNNTDTADMLLCYCICILQWLFFWIQHASHVQILLIIPYAVATSSHRLFGTS